MENLADSAVNFADKIVLVTGSTRGIGWHTARAFARCGATVILNGRSDQAQLDACVKSIGDEFGTPCSGMLFDVADAAAVKQCYQQIFKNHKRLDVLVNNAGIMQDGLLGMISADNMQKTISVNTIAALTNLQEAARLMARNKSGSIINVTSIIGLRGAVGQSLYAASKSALVGMTLAAAKELAPQNVRVNAVAPGLIDTDMAHTLSEEKLEERVRTINMGRIGKPEEVAHVILFLASDLASYVTGQVIGVDGGMVL